MGYVPGFSNDIFISYSHIDDQAVDGPGWVTDFHRRLVIEVEEELGAKVQVWRDKRISGATDFTKDLDRQVRGSAMLLAILSPGYVNSRWCEWELSGFAGSRRTGDLWVDTKCRAVKIFKRPADVGGLRVLAETEGIRFFDVDSSNDVAHEMEGSAELYKHRLTELGHDIGSVLRAMRKARTVFLGTATSSLHDQKERVRQELAGRQYRILEPPDGPSDDQMRLGAAVRDSALSVLFYDRTAPSGDPADAAAARERRVAMEQQATQIVVVHEQPGTASHPWDELDATARGSTKVEWLIEPQPHALYHTVLQMLEAQPAATSPGPDPAPPVEPAPHHPAASHGPTPAAAAGAGSRELVRVYLVCDQRDHPLLESNRARRVRDYLLSLGYEVKLPLAEHDDASQFSRDNRTKLKQCDAVLLYWGTARQAWFDQRLGELTQARGWRQGRAFAALGAYVADPESPVKQNYETRELDELIKQFQELDIADARLVRFVGRLAHTP